MLTQTSHLQPLTSSGISNAQLFKALGDENRLAILDFIGSGDRSCCLREDGVCGCDIQSHINLSQATTSHHLKILVEAGLLSAEKRGKWTFYSLVSEKFAEIADFLQTFSEKEEL